MQHEVKTAPAPHYEGSKSLRDKVEAQGGKVLHEGRTLRGAEAQVFRMALRAKQQRDALSVQQFAADVECLGLSGHVQSVQETPDGGLTLTFAPEPPAQ